MTTPPTTPLSARWRPTAAHLRASVLGVCFVAIGVFMRRPDAVVIGAPLVAVAAWSVLRRPTALPRVHVWLRHPVLREGQTTAWTMAVAPGAGVEDVGLAVSEAPFTRYTPPSQSVARGDIGAAATPTQVAGPDGRDGSDGSGTTDEPAGPAEQAGPAEPVGGLVLLDVECQSIRWGVRSPGAATCAVSAALGAWTWAPEPVSAEPLPTVPLPEVFSARTATPDPDGLVGRSRSRRAGDGAELADVRAFRFGDRLRRIHWPVSVRTGELNVTTTFSDEDAEVLLLVDAMHDLGTSTGYDGESSSLDSGVRAAAAVAEHYLRVGDRVGLQVLGAQASPRIPAELGSNQLRRILDVLARVRVADGGVVDKRRLRAQLRHPVPFGTLVVVLTPAVSVDVLAHAAQLARRGQPVVVVDTLPVSMTTGELPDDLLRDLVPDEDEVGDSARLAWRIRLLERQRELQRTRLSGVPIVPWVGPGTLDAVLRDLGRQRRSPRVMTR